MMRAIVHRVCGKVVGAYWADSAVGFGYKEQAEAFLSTMGVAQVFKFREVRNSRGQIISREHSGSEAEAIERGKTLSMDIREVLETEIVAAMQHDQARELARRERVSAPADEFGNMAYAHE